MALKCTNWHEVELEFARAKEEYDRKAVEWLSVLGERVVKYAREHGSDAGTFVLTAVSSDETRGTVTYAKTVTDLDSDAKFPERNVFVVLGVDRAGFAAHITEALSSYAG